MRPVIPRVHVGDILRGTRNLRNYIQTASALRYLRDIQHGRRREEKARKHIRRPCKNDKFLVTVNAWDMFGVYSLDTEVTLLFGNRPKLQQPVDIEQKRPALTSSKMYMNPTIFSQWFIRTPARMIDLRNWEHAAFYMWTSLHLNLSSIRTGDAVPRFFYCDEGPDIFEPNPSTHVWEGRHLVGSIEKWIPRGITRPRAANRGGYKCMPLGSFGPQLEEIQPMKREINARLSSNPRVALEFEAEACANHTYQDPQVN